jgi:peptide/nickel transport system substrate-binding protein
VEIATFVCWLGQFGALPAVLFGARDGPYKFVSLNPGLELVLEAFDRYWRKPPAVKWIVFKVILEETTRLAALRRGGVDIAYSIRGEPAEELRRTPELTLKPPVVQGAFCLCFPDQWDPKSPWHDERVRRAASLAIVRGARTRR